MAFGISVTATAQDASPGAHDLPPLIPLPPAAATDDTGRLPRIDEAFFRGSLSPAPPDGPPGIPPFLIEEWPGLLPIGNHFMAVGVESHLATATSKEAVEESRAKAAVAEVHWRLGNYDLALADYKAAVALDPRNVGALIGLSRTRAAYGDSFHALNELNAFIKRYPDSNAKVYATRAYIRAGAASSRGSTDLEAATQDVDHALRLDPLEPEARMARALIATERGQYDAAISDLDWLIERQPERAEALIYRGIALMQKHHLDRALADFDRAASGQCGWLRPMLVLNRAQCYAERGDNDRAIADFTEAMRGSSNSPDIYRARAACYAAKDDLEHALSDWDAIVRLRPRDPNAYIGRSLISLEKGDSTRVMADMDRVVQLWPDLSAVYFFRAAMTLMACHDVRRSLADMDRAVKLNPRPSCYYAFRGFLHARASNLVPACRDVALFALTYEPDQYSFSVRFIDWEGPLFGFWFSWTFKDKMDKPGQGADTSDASQQCINLGFQQLLAAVFRSKG